jgi:Xaa-Pro aminopeptidase
MLFINSSRLKKFQAILDVDACIIDYPVDILYLTGLKVSLGRLIVTKTTACLFVDGRYYTACKKNSLVAVELSSESSIRTFAANCLSIGFDATTTTVQQHSKLSQLFSQLLIPLPSPLKEIRAIKDQEEIEALQSSAHLLQKGYRFIESILQIGISEQEVAFQFEFYCRKLGASSLAFEPIIAFGENSALPHHRAGNRLLADRDLVLIDIGVVLNGYASDMTRIIHIGSIDPRLLELESIVRASHTAVLQAVRPGVRLGTLDEIAREVMKHAEVEHLFVHSLGHGIGLETHEYPRLHKEGEHASILLEPGMVFTVEPGLYLPGVGGIRYEDTIAITTTGYHNFYA